jgi:hypothetical protein
VLAAAFLKSLPPIPLDDAAGSKRGAPSSILEMTLPYGPDNATTAQETLRAVAHHCRGGGRRLLIDLRMATDQTEGARLCYRHTLVHMAGPIAVVVGPNVSRFLGEFLVRELRKHHNVKLFLNEERARLWLNGAE